MQRYTIVCKQDSTSQRISKQLREAFDSLMTYDEINPEMVISVGGDGTMLYSVHMYKHMLDTVAFVGLHTGTLGFLTDYQKEEIQQFINDVYHKDYTIYNRYLLNVTTNKETYLALNELRIENNMRSQVLDVYIDEEFLETFRGNGLCVCTSSGSTAYNKSLGGAVICGDNGLMQLSEIAGIHHNAYRSLGSSLILDRSHWIHFESQNFENSVLGIDHLVYDLKDVNCIDVKISNQCARFVQLKHVSMIERLKRAFL